MLTTRWLESNVIEFGEDFKVFSLLLSPPLVCVRVTFIFLKVLLEKWASASADWPKKKKFNFRVNIVHQK